MRKDDKVLIETDAFTVTKREFLVSIILILLFLCTAVLVTVKVSDSVQVHNEKVGRILCIEDSDLFKHSVDTSAGEVLSTADIQCADPVKMDAIKGEYSYIYYTYEEEHLKTRTVTETHTRTGANGKTETYTTTRIEHYYEWDVEDSEELCSTELLVNGVKYKNKEPSKYFKSKYATTDDWTGTEFSRSDSRHIYLSSDKRISYELGELKSSGVIRCNLADGIIKDIETYEYGESDPYEVRESLKTSKSGAIAITWILFTILTGIVVFVFVGLENNWLYSKKEED